MCTQTHTSIKLWLSSSGVIETTDSQFLRYKSHSLNFLTVIGKHFKHKKYTKNNMKDTSVPASQI